MANTLLALLLVMVLVVLLVAIAQASVVVVDETVFQTLMVQEAVRFLTKSGHLAGAGFDVYSVEPIVKTNPLLEAEHCWLSPHTAAFTAESLKRMSVQSAQNIIDQFNGGVPTRNIYALEVYSPDHT